MLKQIKIRIINSDLFFAIKAKNIRTVFPVRISQVSGFIPQNGINFIKQGFPMDYLVPFNMFVFHDSSSISNIMPG